MPVVYHTSGAGVPDCLLLLLKPNWEQEVKVTYTLESEQSEGLTGIEYRAPKSRAFRLRMSWSCSLQAADADALRKALPQLGDMRVGVPLWPDAFSLANAWLHTPQRVISWNASGAYAITAPAGSYAYASAAPLLIGRLSKRPSIEPEGRVLWDVDLEVVEDSPWDCRISPASGYVPTSFIWDPEWTNITDVSRDQLRQVSIGEGRETGVAGGDGTPRWGQEAGVPLYSRGEIADFLRFWCDRQGSVKAFSCPAWCQPGAASSGTPNTYVARFDKDLVVLTFLTPKLATTKIKLWQEVAIDGGALQSGPAQSFIYAFTWDEYPPVCLTSWEHDLVVDGSTYTPAVIGHDQLRRTLSALGDECNVSMFEGAAISPMGPMVAGEAERRLTVEIRKVLIDSTGTVTSTAAVFSGDVRSVELSDSKITGHAKTLGGIFQRKIPRHYLQKGCNYTLADECCKLTKSALAVSGALTGVAGATTISFGANPTLPASYADKWFAGGWLEVVASDASRHRRAILNCSQSGASFSLQLNRPLPATCEGRTATCYPGCSGDYSVCGGKFGNAANFGGFPFVPPFLSTSNGNGTTPKAK